MVGHFRCSIGVTALLRVDLTGLAGLTSTSVAAHHGWHQDKGKQDFLLFFPPPPPPLLLLLPVVHRSSLPKLGSSSSVAYCADALEFGPQVKVACLVKLL